MHMKYFQAIGRIIDHYDDILREWDRSKYGHLLLETWGIEITSKEKELIIEEREVLRYLMGCQLSLVRDTNSKKPKLEIAKRCFNRHLTFLEKIHSCHAYNVNKYKSKLVQKEYKACKHYLFKFSLPAWYEKLPEEILTFENQYPDFGKERDSE